MEQKRLFKDRVLPLVVTLLAFMVFTSACGSKKSKSRISSPNSPGTIVAGGCTTNCNASGLLLRTQSIYDSLYKAGSMVVTLDLIGQAGGNYDFNDPKIGIYYNGPIYATGKAVITERNLRLCNAPTGEYVLSAQDGQPGSWQSTVVNNLRIVAKNGPTSLSLIVYSGTPYNPNTINKNELNHMGAWIVVESVGGQPCGEAIRFY